MANHKLNDERISKLVSSISEQTSFGQVRPKLHKRLEDVVSDSVDRFNDRFKTITARWMESIREKVGKPVEEDNFKVPIAKLLKDSYGAPRKRIRPLDLFSPIGLGDLVELSTSLNQSVMSVIVEVPSSDDDPRYTIMDRKGELHYVEKSAFKFRIPRVIPKGWLYKIVDKINNDEGGHGSIKTTVDHEFETFFVNPLARTIIMQPVLKLTNEVWNLLPDLSRTLEIIHRTIQGDGPKQISIFDLIDAVNSTDLSSLKLALKKGDVHKGYMKVSNSFEELGTERTLHPQTNLGKSIKELPEDGKIEISLFYAVVLALRKQNRLWSTSYSSRSTMVPLSVTVNPLEDVNKVESIVERLKKNPNLSIEFQIFLKRRDFSSIPPELEDIFSLLKQYAVGNIEDPIAETAICQLMKKTTVFGSADVTKTHVYDLLTDVGYIDRQATNPMHFSNILALPGKNVSSQDDIEQDFYDLTTVEKDNKDPSAAIRKDFGDLKVYCIDSETAHEIDDGVSIERIDDSNVVLHIHIADPASYIEPEGTISKIAFKRAFTTYQPELHSPMLPQSLVDVCGLGVNGRKTRAMTYSVPYNYKSGLNLLEAQVRPSFVSNFPKYTYKTVDETLTKVSGVSSNSLTDEERDLSDLFKIAEQLRKDRVDKGAVVFKTSMTPRVTVSSNNEDSSDLFLAEMADVQIEAQETTNSVVLVSELMILANSVSATVMHKNNIPGIFKGMDELKLEGSAAKVISSLNEITKNTGEFPDSQALVKALKFINPAFYSPKPIRHLMLGVDFYSPSTSPLRRFGDLINHWQFHSYLNTKQVMFNKDQTLFITMHIEARNDILKKAQRRSNSFYCINLIRNQIKNKKLGKYSFLVSSRPRDGSVNGMISELGIFGFMELNSNIQPPKIGDIITNFEFVELDSVDSLLRVRQLE